MAYFLVAWLILLILSLAIGCGIMQGFGSPISLLSATAQSRTGLAAPFSPEAILVIWVGLLGLAIALFTVSLFLPLSPGVGLLVGVGLAAGGCAHPPVRQALGELGRAIVPWCWVGGLAIALTTALITTQPVVWGDTGLYHYGSVRWLADYGTVIGVALIHDRFGFASSWFALAAPFNPAMLGARAIALTNGFILLLVLLQYWAILTRLFTEKTRLSDWFGLSSLSLLLALFFSSSLMMDLIISPSPDIPIILLAVVMAWFILLTEHRTDTLNPARLAFIILSLGAASITLKLSGLPLLFIGVLFFGKQFWQRPRKLGQGIVLVGVLLTPGAVFGWLTSGCPLYPASVLCLDLPWSLPQAAAVVARAQINGWQDWFGTPPEGALWLPWVLGQWLKTSITNKLFFILGLLSIIAVGALLRQVQRLAQPSLQVVSWVLLLGLSGSLFTVLLSPLLRFGLGYLILIPTLLAAWLGMLWLEPRRSYPFRVAASSWGRSPVLGLGAIALLVALTLATRRPWLWLPPSMQSGNVVAAEINDVRYFHPIDVGKGVCWDAPNPCALGPIQGNIQLRQPSQGIAGGFQKVPSPSVGSPAARPTGE